ncbi:MAG TPA: FAD-dependent oxidoreductase [Pyrinomonadaceae bacterium]|nr:FAD-dependent oxidoreductase [Pyrinomonadaceae bacterium]
MTHEVVVVGAGVGGLSAAALLAARGVSVCVVEKESRGGGCAAAFEKFGYRFDPTAGLYAGWGEGEIFARVFAELNVAPPEARRLAPAYAVRMPDGAQVRVGGADADEFDAELRLAFPECAAFAVDFYRGLDALDASLREWSTRPARPLPPRSIFSRLKTAARRDSDDEPGSRLARAAGEEALAQSLAGASPRFRRFLDSQLQLFTLRASDQCSRADAARALTLPRRGLYALRGGAQSLADALTESIKRSGGAVRFDTTALRLAYDAAGAVVGVDLLSGETLRATRAVVSNLTAWDTYGKLVGASRTPADVRARLKSLRGRGAYLVFIAVEEAAAARLPAGRVIAATDSGDGEEFDPARAAFALNCAPAWDARAPEGRRAATLSAFADASEWFAYHEDESEHESQDNRALEFWWGRLHAALPELGEGCEVIETLTPRGYYELTRRRLGTVWGATPLAGLSHHDASRYRTHLPNLYMVGDTVSEFGGTASVARTALAVVNVIAPASA